MDVCLRLTAFEVFIRHDFSLENCSNFYVYTKRQKVKGLLPLGDFMNRIVKTSCVGSRRASTFNVYAFL